MGVNYEVHKIERIPGTMQTRVTKVTPYVRLCAEGDPPLFIQEGKVYPAEGAAIPLSQLPPWFWEELRKVNPAILKETQAEHLLERQPALKAR